MDNEIPAADLSKPAPLRAASTSPISKSHDSTSGPSSKKSVWGRWVVKLVLVAAAFGTGWYFANARHEHHEKEKLPVESVSKGERSSSVVVTAEQVTHRPVQRTVDALGTLYGFEEVPIIARVEGRVRRVLHDVSDRVQPGELLLEIDPTDYDLTVQQSDKAIQVELAKLGLSEPPKTKQDLAQVPIVVKARSLMEHAKSRLDRLTRLAQSKNASAEDLDNAASDYRTAQAEYDNQMIQAEAGLATIQLKQVDLLVAREKLVNTKLTAPSPTMSIPGSESITYVVSQRSVAEGTVVQPGKELFRVVISQTLKFRVPVPERFGPEIQNGQVVQVFTASRAEPYAGTVTRIYPTVDTTTRTFQVEIHVPNPKGELKPGGFAKASILTHLDPQAATIPLAGLMQFAGIIKIFVVEHGLAREVPVTLGTQTTEWVEILKPELPADTLVITSGQTVIANQTPVTVRSSEIDRGRDGPATSGTVDDSRAAKQSDAGTRE